MRSTAETGKWPAHPYSSSGAGSGVVLCHRAAASACFIVDAAAAAANCTPEGAAQIRPADCFLYNHCPNSRGLHKFFFGDGFLQL